MKPAELNTPPSSSGNTNTMPVLFIGHGSPMNAIEDNLFSRKWKELGETLPEPKAILCVSAHWETRGVYVTAMDNPKTIHDFGGFPRELYSVQYPAPGDPGVAAEVIKAVKNVEIAPDQGWGLDHGTWSILKHMYPEAGIPVIQLSLDPAKPPEFHYELGRSLARFREQGILIIGSGNLVHNLRMVAWERLNEPGFGYDWALEANEKIKKFIVEGDHPSLIHFRSLGRSFDLAIPTTEHFLPLLYILGLTKENEHPEFFNDAPVAGSLTMTSVIFNGK
jgi:4,5-DOPA dioxygenase extradiol